MISVAKESENKSQIQISILFVSPIGADCLARLIHHVYIIVKLQSHCISSSCVLSCFVFLMIIINSDMLEECYCDGPLLWSRADISNVFRTYDSNLFLIL